MINSRTLQNKESGPVVIEASVLLEFGHAEAIGAMSLTETPESP